MKLWNWGRGNALRPSRLSVFALALLAALAVPALAFAAGDPNGAATLEADSAAPITFVWMLVAGALVYFMQAGFAMVEAGFCRAKNANNLMMKNLLDFVMGTIAYFAIGFGIMYGADAYGLFGTDGWFLSGDFYDVTVYRDFFFQVVFAATAATIVSGAVAERLKFNAYLVYSVVISAVIYPLYGHWVWGGGWLSQLGMHDFAGSAVVHAIGGFMALAGAIVLGPRYGKFSKDGKPLAIPGHSIPLAALGVFILWFGWFGFNGGSTLNGNDLRMAVVIANTNIAAAAGSAAALLFIYAKTKVWDVGMALNGALAGLVAITAPCAVVSGGSALLIGSIAGVLVVASSLLVERMGIDDPVGAFSVHGVNGVFGVLAVGLWADGTYTDFTGLFYGGGFDQLGVQALGALVAAVWAFGLGFATFKIMDMAFGIRVSPEEELAGLDVQEHGGPAWGDFVTVNR